MVDVRVAGDDEDVELVVPARLHFRARRRQKGRSGVGAPGGAGLGAELDELHGRGSLDRRAPRRHPGHRRPCSERSTKFSKRGNAAPCPPRSRSWKCCSSPKTPPRSRTSSPPAPRGELDVPICSISSRETAPAASAWSALP